MRSPLGKRSPTAAMIFRLRVGLGPELRRTNGRNSRLTWRWAFESAVYCWSMKINGKHTRSDLARSGRLVGRHHRPDAAAARVTRPLRLATSEDAAHAIKTMQTRGAPLIGAVAAYGLALALRADASDENLERAYAALLATRPTAINLKWALDEIMAAVVATARARSASPRPISAPPKSATRTSPSTRRSAGTA